VLGFPAIDALIPKREKVLKLFTVYPFSTAQYVRAFILNLHSDYVHLLIAKITDLQGVFLLETLQRTQARQLQVQVSFK